MPHNTPRRRPAPDAPRIHICHANDFPHAHYVGRAWAGRQATPLGNPFKGDGAIERFRRWLLDAFAVVYGDGRPTAAQADAVAMVLELADHFREAGALELACWCAPDPCHADVIAKAVMFVVRRDPQYIKAGGVWLRADYDPEFDAEFGLPFVVSRDGKAVRACASLAQARADSDWKAVTR